MAGENEKAISAFRMAIAVAPGHARGHLDLGRAALISGEPGLAVVSHERALELDPRLHEARFCLAKAEMNAGDVRRGCATLEEYVKLAAGVAGEEDRLARAHELLTRFARVG